jgi:hypothetical protein
MRRDVKRDRRYIHVLRREEERMAEKGEGREACFRLSFDVADPFLAIARRSPADDHVGLGLGLRLDHRSRQKFKRSRDALIATR